MKGYDKYLPRQMEQVPASLRRQCASSVCPEMMRLYIPYLTCWRSTASGTSGCSQASGAGATRAAAAWGAPAAGEWEDVSPAARGPAGAPPGRSERLPRPATLFFLRIGKLAEGRNRDMKHLLLIFDSWRQLPYSSRVTESQTRYSKLNTFVIDDGFFFFSFQKRAPHHRARNQLLPRDRVPALGQVLPFEIRALRPDAEAVVWVLFRIVFAFGVPGAQS
nr:uncharacterized protein LOC110147931 [Odocoileus virginianus texanus]